jgi:hypothetical protein
MKYTTKATGTFDNNQTLERLISLIRRNMTFQGSLTSSPCAVVLTPRPLTPGATLPVPTLPSINLVSQRASAAVKRRPRVSPRLHVQSRTSGLQVCNLVQRSSPIHPTSFRLGHAEDCCTGPNKVFGAQTQTLLPHQSQSQTLDCRYRAAGE